MKKYKASDLMKRLRFKYGEAYVVLEQVADCTGAAYQSWVDAVVISLWPSNGLIRRAFEIKVDRNDYLREIQNPRKNAWARECFEEFWYVAPKEVIKTIHEVPEGCGWMTPHGKTLRIMLAAERKENAVLDNALLASLARSLQKEKQEYIAQAAKNVLEKSGEHQRALVAKSAIERFLEERGEYYSHSDDMEALLQKLNNSTIDKKNKEERDRLLRFLNTFQNEINDLFEIFAIIARLSLLKRDEAGEFIVNTWGGLDEKSIKTIRKSRPKGTINKKSKKNALALRSLIDDVAKKSGIDIILGGDDG
ncbi:MAG: hypothetical protein GF375_04985 [Candidatus Omnitrophica bacterium]|nr:hypothetical protein [Candidatus Omnitrophota bacterium]